MSGESQDESQNETIDYLEQDNTPTMAQDFEKKVHDNDQGTLSPELDNNVESEKIVDMKDKSNPEGERKSAFG